MRKGWIKYIVLLIAIIVAILFFPNKWFPSLMNIFKQQPVIIENTPILIKEINELAQLCTITAFDEVVADSVVIRMKSGIETLIPDFSGFGTSPVTGKRIVIIGKGKVVAGVDLKNLNAQSVFVQGDSVALALPRAMVLDAIMNPSDFDTFIETGDWSNEAVTAVKIKARKKMIERAMQQGILEKANSRSVMLLENFLRGLGFKKVVVKTTG